ncbi:hypothetical protein [Nocardia otitidiscaviarum]|uniref:hypothetical protein n=1 Tax=Nocardia otitidiscaviarum TaxID=1823 RepID=UPI0024540ADF|nr:hypothetical protein [Nocardia otitidiscaviarum]
MTGNTTQFGTVVGLDISLTATGFACTRPGDPSVWTELVESKGSKSDTWDDRWKRLNHLVAQITSLIPEDDYPLIVTEAPAYASTTGSAMDRHGLWWLTYDALTSAGYWIVPVPPNTLKKYVTGSGNAHKDAVLAATVRQFPTLDINDNNIADAVGLARIGCRLLGAPIDDPHPALRISALDRLALPEGFSDAVA